MTSVGSPSRPLTLMMTRRSPMKLSTQVTRHSSIPTARIFRSRHPLATQAVATSIRRASGLLSLYNGDPDCIHG